MYRSILVPIDGSDHARKALDVACQLATPSQATIYLLNVPELPEAQDTLGKAIGASALDASEAEASKAGLKLVEHIRDAEEAGHTLVERIKTAIGLENIELQPIVKMGVPADVIASEAERLNVDAIVMGSRGLSDIKGLMVGSVSHKVMHIAKCTVITVH